MSSAEWFDFEHTFNRHQESVYDDAVRHDLYHEYKGLQTAAQRRRAAIARIVMECAEAYAAAEDAEEFAEECADIVLITESMSAYCGIRLGGYIEEKRIKNQSRSIRHE